MGSIYQVQHKGIAQGQQILNTSYWATRLEASSPLIAADITSFLDIMHGRWETWFCPLFHLDYTHLETTVKEVTGWDVGKTGKKKLQFGTATLPAGQASKPGTILGVGGIAGDSLPLTVAAICHWNTGTVGRRRRGRFKLSPYAEADNTGNQMTSQKRTDIFSAAEAYRGDCLVGVGPIEVQMQVFSTTTLFSVPQPGNPRTSITKVTASSVTLTWGVQKSRKFSTQAG